MRVVDSWGRTISSLDEWRRRVFDGTSKSRHWRKGRSAHSLAEFIIGQRNGAAHLQRRISSVLGLRVKLEETTPEYLARFDSYPGGPSNLDLGITGRVGCSDQCSSLFIGVEAKVDETFGSTVKSRYTSAVNERSEGKRTNAPERMKDLLSRYFSVSGSPDTSRFASIRYQLLTGTAGTVSTPAEVSVFYILVFRTSLYDEKKGLANQRDYENFVEAVHGRSLTHTGNGSRADELELNGKRLVCIYDSVNL